MGNNQKLKLGRRDILNILFITQRDPFYTGIFFEEFLERYPNLKEIKGVVICNTMGKKSLRKMVGQMYNFYGLRDFLRMGIRFIGHKLLARIFGFLKMAKFYTIEQTFRFHNIEVIKRNDINSIDFLREMGKKNLDLIISVAAPKIFKKPLLKLPRYACINIHTAKLPKYRGMMPNFWNLYNNEKYTGITIHTMDEKIDAGKIVLQKEVEIKEGESLDSLIKRTKKLGAGLMLETLRQIKTGEVKYSDYPDVESSYYSFPKKKDIREFRRRGKRIF